MMTYYSSKTTFYILAEENDNDVTGRLSSMIILMTMIFNGILIYSSINNQWRKAQYLYYSINYSIINGNVFGNVCVVFYL